MTQEHPIAPTHEQVAQWGWEAPEARDAGVTRERYIAAKAARWGADKELEACCEWVDETGWLGAGDILCAARRSKLPSLKEEVKQIVDCLIEGDCLNDEDALTLRRALESLPD